jgi:hypothetical protein
MMVSSPFRLRLALAAVASFFLGASSIQCGSSASGSGAGGAGGNAASSSGASNAGGHAQTGGGAVSTGGGSGPGGGATSVGGSGGAGVGGGGGSGGSIDPAPTSCDAGGVPPPPPGGSASCPDDKNLPGCPCPTKGQSAACWTGLRENRGHGDCQDGMTTCTKVGGDLVWGSCDGEVLPAGNMGAAACTCFSTGVWAIKNLEPCFLTTTDGMGNMSTVAYASTDGNPVTCPFDAMTGLPTVPAGWSTDTLTVDCSGYWSLCYTLKAGDPNNPKPTDCTFASVCTAAHYAPANTVETFPPLPGWESTPSEDACVQQFLNAGGYAEMSVQGQSDECETIGRVFSHVTYCPTSCNQPNPPPSCTTCMSGGGGTFIRVSHTR